MAATAFFYKNSNDIWVYGNTHLVNDVLVKDVEYYASSTSNKLRFETINGIEMVGVWNPILKTNDLKMTPITELGKNDDLDCYANRLDFDLAVKDFFFRVSSGSVSGDYFVLTGPGVRFGYRDGGWVIDKTLTATGFDGVQDTDWEQIGGQVSA